MIKDIERYQLSKMGLKNKIISLNDQIEDLYD